MERNARTSHLPSLMQCPVQQPTRAHGYLPIACISDLVRDIAPVVYYSQGSAYQGIGFVGKIMLVSSGSSYES